jgi:hypothetical protein
VRHVVHGQGAVELEARAQPLPQLFDECEACRKGRDEAWLPSSVLDWLNPHSAAHDVGAELLAE